METRLRLAALFLLSVALIAFELSIMRVFAVGSWSNFGNLIISTALLGFGLAGAVLTFLSGSVEKRPDTWLLGTSLGFTVSMAIAQALSQRVPFEPTFLGADPGQMWLLALYYIIYGLPFVFGASFIGVCFVVLRGKIHQLYFWNMTGSGLGGFFIIVCMYLLPPAQLVVPVMALAFVATLLVMLKPGPDGRLTVPSNRFLVVVGATVIGFALAMAAGQIRISEFKSISYARKYPELNLKHHSFSPAGEYHVFQSSYFHFAPGLSDNASLNPDTVPNQAFWALYIDGSGPIGIMGQLESAHASYVDYLPMAAPYEIMEAPKALLVNLGGGINAQVARYKGASSVTVIEQDPELIRLMRDDPAVADFTGHLLEDARIQLVQAEARAWCAANPGSYDLVDISLVDSIGLSDSGGYAVRENYTYTKEAIADYLKGLQAGGMVSITVWNNLSPPRNVLRLMATITASLREQGVADPGKRIFMFDQLRSTATILIKNSDFSETELDSLKAFVERNSFNLIYAPGMPALGKDLYAQLVRFAQRFDRVEPASANPESAEGSAPVTEAPEAQPEAAEVSTSELYQLFLMELLAGNEKKLEDAYVFDIRPMSDDRPFYAGYLKLGELFHYLGNINEISEEWGYLLLLGVLVQASVFGLLVILAPVVGRWNSVFQRSRGKLGVILYFASLGLSYMLVEIFLMQRLVVFLGNPIFAVSIVITAMLIISGVGNLISPRLSPRRVVRVRIAFVGILLSLAFYAFGLPLVVSALQNTPLVVRIIATVLVIAPAAFFMGIPYPTGLEALTEKRPRLLPWAWGMNGGLSVAGTALAWIVSLAWGFRTLIVLAIALYLLVAILAPVNEFSDQEAGSEESGT